MSSSKLLTENLKMNVTDAYKPEEVYKKLSSSQFPLSEMSLRNGSSNPSKIGNTKKIFRWNCPYVGQKGKAKPPYKSKGKHQNS